MAKLKKCPHCGGYHRMKRAYLKCKNAHVKQSWPK